LFSQSLKDSLFGGKLKVDTGVVVSSQKEEKRVNVKSEFESVFPAGEQAWREFLSLNMDKIVELALKNQVPKGKYELLVSFITNIDSTLSIYELKCIPYNSYIEKEVIKVFEKSPNWYPASQNGKYVKNFHKQPLTFNVQ